MDLDELGIVSERPPSLDAEGRRITIHPFKVKGKFRRARTMVQIFLLFVFLVLPWTEMDGTQTILIDIFSKRFIFFGHTFYAHDAPLIFFILSLSAFSIFLITALWGRLWCGWACPQTVFIDAIYRQIEEWIEGKYTKRYQLDRAPWSKTKIFKRSLKWLLFLLVSLHIAHSFAAYFIGAEKLVWMSLKFPSENLGTFIFVQVLAFLTLVNFAWFREQFCLIVCPYGRFQSVLMDENSKAILYDSQRGEPRKTKGIAEHGDCVNCFRCVSACPTGIDIRNGLQLECIACTACADACDEIMDKTGSPRGLIRYSSEALLQGKERKAFSTRTMSYVAILVVLFVGFGFALANRTTLVAKIIRAVDTPYTVVQEDGVDLAVNHFKIHFTNQSGKDVELKRFDLENIVGAKVVSPQFQGKISPGQSTWVHIFIKAPTTSLRPEGKKTAQWTMTYFSKATDRDELQTGQLTLLGP